MKKLIPFLFIAIFFYNSYSQDITWGDENVKSSDFKLNVQKSVANYSGSYHFGISEIESNLKIEIKGKVISADLNYSDWDKKTEKWVNKKITLYNIKIIGNMFLADGWYGIFVKYSAKKKKLNEGLIIYKASYDYIKNEFASKWKE